MKNVETYRKALQELGLRSLGLKVEDKRLSRADQRAALLLDDIIRYPSVYIPPIQDPDTGNIVFTVGITPVGSSSSPIGG
jgi:hypothetical protein